MIDEDGYEDYIEGLKAERDWLKDILEHPEKYPMTTWYEGKSAHMRARLEDLERELERCT